LGASQPAAGGESTVKFDESNGSLTLEAAVPLSEDWTFDMRS